MVDAFANLQKIFELDDNPLPPTSYVSLNHSHSHPQTPAMDILSSYPGACMQISESIFSKANSIAERIFQFSVDKTNDNVIICQWCSKLGHKVQSCFEPKLKHISNPHYIRNHKFKFNFVYRKGFLNRTRNSSSIYASTVMLNSYFHKKSHHKNFVIPTKETN